MAARKIAISLPEDLLEQVDATAEELGETRSGYIARILVFASTTRSNAVLRRRVDALFSDPEIQAEQRSTARRLNRNRPRLGTEW